MSEKFGRIFGGETQYIKMTTFYYYILYIRKKLFYFIVIFSLTNNDKNLNCRKNEQLIRDYTFLAMKTFWNWYRAVEEVWKLTCPSCITVLVQ